MEKLESYIKAKERTIKGDRIKRMSTEKLNERYVKEKLKEVWQDCMYLDEIVPIIRKMLSEAYIDGLEQYKFDLKMDVLTGKIAIPEELANDKDFESLLDMPTYKELHEESKQLKDKINKAIEYIKEKYLFDFKYDNEEIFEIITDDKATKELLEILGDE